jgi:DNA mismatch repair protein MSH2
LTFFYLFQFAKVKANDLEDYQTISHTMEEGDADGASDAKKRRLTKQHGEEIINDFLTKIKALPVGNMSPGQLKAEISKLRNEVAASDNPFIQDILTRMA